MLYPSNQRPDATPVKLPPKTIAFLARSCKMDDNDVEACWAAVKDVVWQEDEHLSGIKDSVALETTFHQNGSILFRMCVLLL